MNLNSIQSEDEPDAAIAKLNDQVKEMKAQLLECAIKIKVRQFLDLVFRFSSGS